MDAPLPFSVVDSHVHFWDPARLHYPWLSSVPRIATSHLPADYWREADAVPVSQVIFVEADCATVQARQENDWALELAAEDARLAAVVAQVPMDAGAATAHLLDVLAARPLVRGVRHLIQGAADPEFCLRPAFVEGVRRLTGAGLCFDLCVHHGQLAAAVRLVDQCPGVRFVLDHLGKPGVRTRLLEPWQEQFADLAARPNVWCKLSGLLTEADAEHWTPGDFQPYLAHAFACFGPERLIFGSDWPVCRLAGTLADWVRVIRAAVAANAPLAEAKIFGENAGHCYGFGARSAEFPAGVA